MQDKRCTKCGETKPLDEFARQASCRDGYRPDCKACRSAYWKAHRTAHHERYVSRERARYEQNAARILAELRKPCPRCGGDKGEGERRHVCDACRLLIPAERVAAALAWQKVHPEAVKQTHRRKAVRRRLRKQDRFVEDVHPLVVLERADGACGICGDDVEPFRFDVDHIVPLSKGGEHSYRNTQPAHPACNNRKGAKAP